MNGEIKHPEIAKTSPFQAPKIPKICQCMGPEIVQKSSASDLEPEIVKKGRFLAP